MEFLAAASLALSIIDGIRKAAPVINDVIKDFTSIGEAAIQKATGKPLTSEQREQFKQMIIDNHNRFQQPIPPEENQ